MSTKESLNFKIPISWYRRLRSVAHAMGMSCHDIIRLGIIKGLCRIYLMNLDVHELLDNVYERYEPKTSIHPRVPRWLKKAITSFAEDLGIPISAFCRACLAAAFDFSSRSITVDLRLSPEERRFIENLREEFERW